MADNSIYVPVGRFVHGSLDQLRTVDGRRVPIPPEKQNYEFGVAIPKTSPNIPAFFQKLIETAHEVYAGNHQAINQINAWTQNGMAGFSMKVRDGDRPNQNGEVNQHTAGCFVVQFSRHNKLGPFRCIDNTPEGNDIDVSTVRRGYDVDVAASIKANGLQGENCGIYMNAEAVRLVNSDREVLGGGMSNDAIRNLMPVGTAQPAQHAHGMPQPGQPPVQQPPMQQQPGQYGVPGQPPMQQPPGQYAAPGNAMPPVTQPGAPMYGGAQGGIPGMQPAGGNTGATGTASPSDPQPHYGIMPPGSVPGR